MHIEKQELSTARSFLSEAEEIAQELNTADIPIMVSIACMKLGLKELRLTNNRREPLLKKLSIDTYMALKQSKDHNFKRLQGEAVLLQARIETEKLKHSYKDAIKKGDIKILYRKSIELFRQVKDRYLLANAYCYFASFLKEINNVKSAETFLKRATAIFNKLGLNCSCNRYYR